MKKRLMAVALALVCLTAVTACGSTENAEENAASGQTAESGEAVQTTDYKLVSVGTKNLAQINPDDFIKSVGNYENVTLEAKMNVVTEDDIDLAIQQLLNGSQTVEVVEGRELQSGDIANINYCGKLDGVAFEGGTDDSEAGYDLEIGSGSFIPGFEDALIGMNTGETRDIDVTFPDTYPVADLAGKPVVFTVTVNAIKERVTPELTEEFVAAQNIDGVKIIPEFREDTRKRLEERAQQIYDSQLNNSALMKIIEVCEFGDTLPQERYQYYYNNMVKNDQDLAIDYGMDLETFVVTYYGKSKEEYYAAVDEACTNSVKADIAAMAILKAANVTMDDEQINSEIEKTYADYGCASADEFREKYDIEEFGAYLINVKAMDIVKKNATVVEPTEDTAE